MGTLVHKEILCPQEKIINAKGYNGKVMLPCGSRISGAGINLDGDDNEPTDMDVIVVSCENARMTKVVMNPTPLIISINCKYILLINPSAKLGWTPCRLCSKTYKFVELAIDICGH